MALHRLTTLGALSLRRDGADIEGAALQLRRLALLAALAATPRGMSRDVLAELLWSESEPQRGRHSLDQALSALRLALGSRVFSRGGAMLALNPEIVAADVTAFDEAIAAGAWERAAASYGGPFLEGIHLREAGEFERWVERERNRRSASFARALEAMALDASARGDAQQAVAIWRRRRDVDPLSGRLLIEHARAMEAAGERAAALRESEAYVEWLLREIGERPEPGVVALVDELRRVFGGPPREAGVGTRPDRAHERMAAAARPRYTVKRYIAGGAMYTTYLGREVESGDAVTLRALAAEIVATADTRRLLRELGLLVALEHPNIIPLVDAFTRDGVVILVHAAFDDETLRDRMLRQREMPLVEVETIARDVGAALGFAHSSGVLHGDLTRRRILATRRHRVMDFGIMPAIRASTATSAQETAILIGNRAYMSPEVLTDTRVPDERSDIFSFGVVLFQALTGDPPRRSSALDAGLADDPERSLRTMRPGVPPVWGAALARALAPLPTERFPTAAAFLDALGIA